MSIRPIDMQVAIPKLGEVSRMSHLEQQKAGLHQSQNSATTEKQNHHENRSISQSQKDAKSGSESDARKKGRNEYLNRRGKKQEDDKSGGPEVSNDGLQHRIDIQI